MDSYSRDDTRVDSYRGRRSPDARSSRNRNRSRSPQQIDRYQPGRQRDDYFRPPRDDHHRERRRSSPHSGGAKIDRYVPGEDPPAPVITTNPINNPMNMDFQVGFNYFAEWWRMEQQVKDERERQKNGGRRPERVKGERESREEKSKERELIQAAYDSYKEKLQVQMARAFVSQHKGEEWFKERYDVATRDKFREELARFRREAYSQWEVDLEEGLFDEFTLEGIYKNESNGAGGIIEKEEGETTAANEVLGVGDLVPTRGGDLRDDAANQPTLLIKTIAPTVSREKMEAFCNDHLGEGPGGFKWLSLSDPNPLKKCHRIGWVILNKGGEDTVMGGSHDDQDNEMKVEDAEQGAVDGADGTENGAEEGVVEQTVVTPIQKALNELNGKTIHDEERGDFTCHVGIHETPSQPRKKALWDLFSAPERVDRDLQLAIRLVMKLDEELGGETNGFTKIEHRVEDLRGRGLLQPAISGSQARKAEKDPLDEDEEMEEGEEEEEGAFDEEVDDEELLAKKKKLDLLVEYLRRVYNFCFFCVFESDSVHELVRKCAGGHLRRPRSSLTTAAKAAAKASAAGEPFPLKKQEIKEEAEVVDAEDGTKKFMKPSQKNQQQLQRAFNWVKTYEEKLLQILDPDSADLKKLGGKPLEEALEEELSKYVKQEDEAKYRCKVPECTKLFKGQNFWKKHVEKRHEEWFEKLKQDIELVNSYVLDPAHIAPSRSDANSNGHFPLNNHMPTGTPRGFNLSNMAPYSVAGMPNPAAFQAFLATQGINPAFGGTGRPEDDRHGGPMRQRGRFNNRAGGPYDRPSNGGRNMRWNSSGRLTPPRAGGAGRMGGNPRFTEGGAATVGPREAVQGRSLKSYEDLDAADGGNAELNY